MTDNLPDLTDLTDFQLNQLEGKLGVLYATLRRAQVEQLKAKAEAEAKAKAAKEAAEQAEAERKARTFSDARDQLSRLGRTKAVGDIGAVDGPKVKAVFDHVAEMDRQHELARREALRMLADAGITDWNLDYAATRPVETMRKEAAASQGAGFLIAQGEAKTWAGAQRQLSEGKLGWRIPKVNRKRSKHGKGKNSNKKGKRRK